MMASFPNVCVVLLLAFFSQSCSCSTREVMKWENGFPGVIWVVQISDLHISSFHPDRATALKRIAPLLSIIKPALLLITGDLTDAKNKRRTVTRQDEAEWMEYHEVVETFLNNSQLQGRAFFDVRGNHDMYGVPFVGSSLDFYSRYSISARFNRTDRVQSVTLMGNDGSKFLFVGIDNSMEIGLRGPSNFFGHPSDSSLFELDMELGQWDNSSAQQVPKIVFGHFPLSFTTSTKMHGRMEDILAKHSISAYICGHLHSKFGKNLYKHHIHSIQDSNEFWEWEIGDWRGDRIMRVLAIDKGLASFVDIDLSDFEISSQLPVIVLPTSPLNSQTMQRYSSFQSANEQKINAQQSIRALIFSERHIVSVVAKIFVFSSGLYELVEDLELHLNGNWGSEALYYGSEWDILKYSGLPGRFWLQVIATDHFGNQSASLLQPFSPDGKVDILKLSWMEYLVINLIWEDLYYLLIWGTLFILFSLLFLPKVLGLYLQRHYNYDKWAASLLNPSHSKPCYSRWLVMVPAWILVEGSRNWWLWCGRILYMTYLLLFPWFFGNVLADGYPAGSMYFRGWTVQLSHLSPHMSKLGVPDIMGITLQFFYLVLLPSYLTISSILAERAAWKFHMTSKFKCKGDDVPKQSRFQEDSASNVHKQRDLPPSIVHRKQPSCNICQRRLRAGLIVCCLGILVSHLRLCFVLAGAYGKLLLTSLGFVWPVPLLLAAALFLTRVAS